MKRNTIHSLLKICVNTISRKYKKKDVKLITLCLQYYLQHYRHHAQLHPLHMESLPPEQDYLYKNLFSHQCFVH